MYLGDINYPEVNELFGMLPMSNCRYGSHLYVVKNIDGKLRFGSMSGRKFSQIWFWCGTLNERPVREVYEE